MKAFRKLILSLAVLVLSFAMNACASTPATPTPPPTEEPTPTTAPTSTDLPTRALQDPNVDVFIPYEPGAALNASIEDYSVTYGGTVSVIKVAWDVKEIKLTNMIQSGESPDAVSLWYQDMPKYAVKGVLQPISDRFDLGNPLFNRSVSEGVFSFGGKLYAVAGNDDPIVLFFNETMFRKNGLKTPAERFAENAWTWSALREAAFDLTADTDSDGISDMYGFGTWIDEVFIVSNGTDMVKAVVGQDGTVQVSLNVDDPKFMESMQFYFDMFNKDQSVQPDHWSWYEGFRDGKLAMFAERIYNAERLVKDKFPDVFDFVPFPRPDSAEKGFQYLPASAWGVAQGAANSEAACAFIEQVLKTGERLAYAPEEGQPPYLTASQIERLRQLKAEGSVTPIFTGYANLWSKFIAFTDDLRMNKPLGTSIEKFRPIFQNEIDRALEAN